MKNQLLLMIFYWPFMCVCVCMRIDIVEYKQDVYDNHHHIYDYNHIYIYMFQDVECMNVNRFLNMNVNPVE